MKVVKKIYEYRIRQQIDIDDMRFGFMKGKGTINAICTVRQMQKKFRAKGEWFFFGFVDLDKAVKEVTRWTIHKLEVEEWLVSAVVSMYTGTKIVVRTVYGNSNCFEDKTKVMISGEWQMIMQKAVRCGVCGSSPENHIQRCCMHRLRNNL